MLFTGGERRRCLLFHHFDRFAGEYNLRKKAISYEAEICRSVETAQAKLASSVSSVPGRSASMLSCLNGFIATCDWSDFAFVERSRRRHGQAPGRAATYESQV